MQKDEAVEYVRCQHHPWHFYRTDQAVEHDRTCKQIPDWAKFTGYEEVKLCAYKIQLIRFLEDSFRTALIDFVRKKPPADFRYCRPYHCYLLQNMDTLSLTGIIPVVYPGNGYWSVYGYEFERSMIDFSPLLDKLKSPYALAVDDVTRVESLVKMLELMDRNDVLEQLMELNKCFEL